MSTSQSVSFALSELHAIEAARARERSTRENVPLARALRSAAEPAPPSAARQNAAAPATGEPAPSELPRPSDRDSRTAELAELRRALATLQQRLDRDAAPHERRPDRSVVLLCWVAMALACAGLGAALGANRAIEIGLRDVHTSLAALRAERSAPQALAEPPASSPASPSVPPHDPPAARAPTIAASPKPQRWRAEDKSKRARSPDGKDALSELDGCGDDVLCGANDAAKAQR
jgi:hypothetical protein